MSRRKATTTRPDHAARTDVSPGSSQPAVVARLQLAALVLAVGVTVLVVHWPVLSAGALIFDDNEYLTDNQLVQNPGWASAGRFLGEVLSPSTVKGYYQPLTMISLMLDAAAGGRPDNLEPFHRTSLLLHAANTVLLVVLLNMLLGRPWLAALVGLLFGIHPLGVEPIAWIGERKTLLATFFGLVSVLLYLQHVRRPQWLLYGCSVAVFVLALMSKPTTVPLPLVLLALDVWPLRRLSGRAVVEKLPFFAVAGVFAVITVVSQRHVELLAVHALSPGQTALLACHNLLFYPLQMLWPARVAPFHEFPSPVSLSNGLLLGAVVGNVVLLAFLAISLRWTRALLVGWLCFFLLLLPTLLNKAYAPSVAWDKYTYLPAVGLLIALAWLIGEGWTRLAAAPRWRWARGAMIALAVVVVVALGWRTRVQLKHWQTTEIVYDHMLRLNPSAPVLHHNLGLILGDKGRFAEAVSHYEQALHARPDLEDLHNNCGNALARLGRLDEAIPHLERAIQLKPKDAKAYNNLGNVLSDKGRLDEAASCYDKALALKPDFADAHNNLAVLFVHRGRLADAAEHYQRALESAPRMPEVHNNLAIVLDALGRTDEAIEHYTKALQIRPAFVEAHRNLALALMKRGKFNEAISHCNQALQLRPGDTVTYNCLGQALVKAGRSAEAAACYAQVLKLDPNNADARRSLQILQQGAGSQPSPR